MTTLTRRNAERFRGHQSSSQERPGRPYIVEPGCTGYREEVLVRKEKLLGNRKLPVPFKPLEELVARIDGKRVVIEKT